MKTRLLLFLFLLLLAGCASRHAQSTEIEPAGLVIAPRASFHVRTEGLEEHSLYVSQLENDVARRLVLAGWQHESLADAELEVQIEIDMLEPGDERGTLAECQLTVYITRAGRTWRFEARGDSAGRWKDDRIPTAVSNAAAAVTDRLTSTQRE